MTAATDARQRAREAAADVAYPDYMGNTRRLKGAFATSRHGRYVGYFGDGCRCLACRQYHASRLKRMRER